MSSGKIHRFRCADCPDSFTYMGPAPSEPDDTHLIFGSRYCKGCKKARRFRPSDPKVYPPSWCPRRKRPAEYRVYSYMNATVRYYRDLLKRNGAPMTPSGFEYAPRVKGTIAMEPTAFQKALKAQSPSKIIGITVYADDVIEIDDGLRPCFFHVTGKKIEVLLRFNKEAALKNLYEGPDVP